MQATVLPLKLGAETKTKKTSKTSPPKRLNWITDPYERNKRGRQTTDTRRPSYFSYQMQISWMSKQSPVSS